jgi:hypothetical protein
MPNNELDQDVVRLAKSIRKIESNDDFAARGKSGEFGGYQYTKPTWESHAKMAGLNVPLEAATREQQNQVFYTWAKKKKDEGYNIGQIASMHNAGEGRPNAYIEGNKGVNKYGVNYDTADYAKKVAEFYQQMKAQGPTQTPQTGYPAPPQIKSDEAQEVAQQPAEDKNIVQKGLEFLFPILEKKERTGLQTVADVGLSALTLIPGAGLLGLGAKGAKAAAAATKGGGLVSTVAKNAGLGYGAGTLSSLSQGNDLGTSVMPNTSNIIGGVAGGALGGLVGRGVGTASSLRASAQKDVADILSPTTKLNKKATQRLSPRLSKEVPFATSREDLASKFTAKADAVGENLEEAYSALPQDAKFEVSSLFRTLQNKIDNLMIDGKVPTASQSKVDAIEAVMKDLANITTMGAGLTSNVANIRKLRQILDAGKKDFTFTDFDTARKQAHLLLSNAIRGEFAKQYPDIGKLNADYHFWQKAAEVLEDAIQRKTGQSGLMRKGIAAGLGAVIAAPTSNPVMMGGSALVMKTLSDIIEGVGWNTLTAKTKSKIADALEKADYPKAQKLLEAALRTAPVLGARGIEGLVGTNPDQINGQ